MKHQSSYLSPNRWERYTSVASGDYFEQRWTSAALVTFFWDTTEDNSSACQIKTWGLWKKFYSFARVHSWSSLRLRTFYKFLLGLLGQNILMVPTMKESTSFSVQEYTSAACVLINGSTFSENPTTDVLVGESPEFKTSKLFLYFIILAFSSLGNGLVFCLISCNRRLRQASSNRLLLNLSACDFLTPLLSIPFDLALEERSYVWPYGAIMCRMLWPATTFTATASALTLAGISLDRLV